MRARPRQREAIGSQVGAWDKDENKDETPWLLPHNEVFGAVVDGKFEFFAHMWRIHGEGSSRVVEPIAGCAPTYRTSSTRAPPIPPLSNASPAPPCDGTCAASTPSVSSTRLANFRSHEIEISRS